jgi:hypothetical protein
MQKYSRGLAILVPRVVCPSQVRWARDWDEDGLELCYNLNTSYNHDLSDTTRTMIGYGVLTITTFSMKARFTFQFRAMLIVLFIDDLVIIFTLISPMLW